MLMRELSDNYGWKMKALRKNGNYIHGFCELPNGDCIDITGIKTAEQMLKDWGADALEESPAFCAIGENIDHELYSFMSTLRLASIFAPEVHKKYIGPIPTTIKNQAIGCKADLAELNTVTKKGHANTSHIPPTHIFAALLVLDSYFKFMKFGFFCCRKKPKSAAKETKLIPYNHKISEMKK